MPVECMQRDRVMVCKCGSLFGGNVLIWVYFYKLDDMLIDAGCPNAAEEIVEAVKPIETILITHYHEDHVGVAPLLQNHVKIYAPSKSINLLLNPPKIALYREIVWGRPQPFKAQPLPSRLEIDGVTIEVVDTPGHSFDHVSFIIDDYIFLGDLVVSPRQIVAMKEENMVQTIDSLKKILKYNFEIAFGGVGVYTREEVEEYLNYLQELKKKVDDLYMEGLSMEEIVENVFPKPSQKALAMEGFSEGEWSRINMVRALLSLE